MGSLSKLHTLSHPSACKLDKLLKNTHNILNFTQLFSLFFRGQIKWWAGNPPTSYFILFIVVLNPKSIILVCPENTESAPRTHGRLIVRQCNSSKQYTHTHTHTHSRWLQAPDATRWADALVRFRTTRFRPEPCGPRTGESECVLCVCMCVWVCACTAAHAERGRAHSVRNVRNFTVCRPHPSQRASAWLSWHDGILSLASVQCQHLHTADAHVCAAGTCMFFWSLKRA